MTRPVKYRDADSLFANCYIKDDCVIWNNQTNAIIPTIAAGCPMAKKFATNSIARIIFTICRFPPASKRLVRWCKSDFCVNPYHHAEAKPYVEKRKKLLNMHDELPEQTSHRHLIAPPDEELERLKPTDPIICNVLMRSAATAGHDARTMPNRRFLGFPTKNYENMPLLPEGPNTAKEGVPLLVIKKKVEEAPIIQAPKTEYDDMDTDQFFAALDAKLDASIAKSKEIPHIDHTANMWQNKRTRT